MFGKKQKKTEKPLKTQNKTNNAVTTLIGEGSHIEGHINSSSSAKIEGKLNGTVNVSETLIIGENGKVFGDINAKHLIVYGNVEGKVKSGFLELKEKGNLKGDIIAETVLFEKGGIFNGNCEMNKSESGDNVTEIKNADSATSFKSP